MKYSNIPTAQSVVLHCKEKGIKDIVISPGSRNAPLTIGFTEDPYFKCYSIVDERCAAFFALGIAQNTGKGVAVLCTSGSALLNYYPAVAEAFYSDIPLLVISADRPKYSIDIGDGQTIRQQGVFKNHIGYEANLKQDVSHATQTIQKFANSLLSTQMHIEAQQASIDAHNSLVLQKGIDYALEERTPVHINVPLEEPLYTTQEQAYVFPELKKKSKDSGTVPCLGLEEFSSIWNKSNKKMILVGVNKPDALEQQFLEKIAEDDSVLVFTETTSNIHHVKFFNSIDSILAPIEKSVNKEALFSDLQPDILVTFGGLVVSKKIKSFLRNYQPKHHWHIDATKANDTFFCLTHHFKCNVNAFFNTFLKETKSIKSSYRNYWSAVKLGYEKKRAAYVKEIPFSDMYAFSKLLPSIPEGYQLHLSNSSTVRYAQLFPLKSGVKVFCNRGTSGIDGSTSTAIGASIYNTEPTLLITGDLSFLYDSNALWNNYVNSNFRIVVLNNSGGGIFRILPGQEETENYQTYFETTHNLEISNLCAMYGMEYRLAEDENTLNTQLESFYENSQMPRLLEIKTPRIINNKILLSYFDFIS
ncbi:2-succinyl-5-enolpyruvyl-6-hydroxy-3-cyclohexene-1-carboxylic-acid synthase [Cellulophaga sp. F20128]|uniref:2-succinyl-5-enolpyruvyl-6-hydroxy-3- cyclohexene-1-carboxylic-acid synthase n=1 Tax=Cellulophaga sp. F20128 TaxID=2926413 RepID=UPI001FF4C84D|nr:2-succinyl-5-enolpyruvyl-6-hydroxy-3-cyclohexene-1-carboxylic-acid synthase [Cellulophaga sp. F20128]MCK0156632.1 2-succinyl-5-enolpyruvyl-6-hydroxy-3-cyclohexene-1-carboxylic-acid synthase [Cellulophaga sp. F20128]